MSTRRVWHVLAVAIAISIIALPFPKSQRETSAQQNGYPLPDFELPYLENMGPYWTGGPHQWGIGPEVRWRDIDKGSGLDFAYKENGQAVSFPVTAMAEGDVIWASETDTSGGLGIEVAVKHSLGGSVVIYGHLKDIWQPILDSRQPDGTFKYHVQPGWSIGNSGDTGTTRGNIHLHIELRDGTQTCCSKNEHSGKPMSWHSVVINGYRIYEYRPNELGIMPVQDPETGEYTKETREVAYNYEGVAIKVAEFPEDLGPHPYAEFVFMDAYTNLWENSVYTWLPKNFECNGIAPENGKPDCEESTKQSGVKFAEHGYLGGGGDILVSDVAPPTSQPQIGADTENPLSLRLDGEYGDTFINGPWGDFPQYNGAGGSNPLRISYSIPNGKLFVTITYLYTEKTNLVGIYSATKNEGLLDMWPILWNSIGIPQDPAIELCAVHIDDRQQPVNAVCTQIVLVWGRGCTRIKDGGTGCPEDFDTIEPTYTEVNPDLLNIPTPEPGQLYVGMHARITCTGGPNNLRQCPSPDCETLGTIPECAELDIIGGPLYIPDFDPYLWWAVEYNGQRGWTAGGEGVTIWLERYE